MGISPAGVPEDKIRARYAAAVTRAQAMGFSFKTAAKLAEGPTDAIGVRLDALPPEAGSVAVEALIGLVEAPTVTVSKAWTLYETEIATDELTGKSDQQKRKWRNAKKRGVDLFVKLNGDIDVEAIDRSLEVLVFRS